jgi:hypothetical protein
LLPLPRLSKLQMQPVLDVLAMETMIMPQLLTSLTKLQATKLKHKHRPLQPTQMHPRPQTTRQS